MPDKLSKEELNVDEWVRRATDDELVIKSILHHRDAPPTPACFHAQQMAEKYLKAYLVHCRKWYPKIHPLDALWEFCYEIDSSFEAVKNDAILLTALYGPTRYPGDIPEFSWEEAERAFATALRIKEFVLARIEAYEKKQENNGFGLIGILIVVAIVALVGGGGLYLREMKQQKTVQQIGIEKLKEAGALKQKIEEQNKEAQEMVDSKKPTPSVPQNTTATINTSNWKTYRNKKYEFEFKIPNDWGEFSPVDGTFDLEVCTMCDRVELGPPGRIILRLKVYFNNAQRPALKEWFKTTLNGREFSVKVLEPDENLKEVLINGNPGLRIVTNVMLWIQKRLFFAKDNHILQLSTTYADDDVGGYPDTITDQIFSTLKFTK